MKKKYLLMTVAMLLGLLTVIGSTLAILNTNTENGIGAATANISVNEINVSIQNETAINRNVNIEVPASVPGGEYICSRSIANSTASGQQGYDIYVKVVINKFWMEKSEEDNFGQLVEGTYAGLSGDQFTDVLITNSTGGSQAITTVSSYEQQYEVNGWIVTYADDEQIVMYYKYPIQANTTSTNFIDAISFDKMMGNEYADKEYHINIDVTAVQKNSAESAIAAELGVFPVFDGSGVIASIKEVR